MFLFKKYPKDIFVTAHYEWIQNDGGAVEKRIKVKGKEAEGMIEKDFTIVTFADMRMKDEKKEYYLKLNTDGKDSAKTPPMFTEELGGDETPNDCNHLLQTVRKVLNS